MTRPAVVVDKMKLRHASSTSSFELFVNKTNDPTPSALRSHHEAFSSDVLNERLLALLPHSSILALRRVSRTTKAWTESFSISPLATLHVPFPDPDFCSSTPAALHRVSRHCQTLFVSVVGSEASLAPFHDLPEQSKLPAFPLLTHLQIVCPASDAFEPLLAFRVFLQSAEMPLLTHISIDSLTLDGIRALRWGPFSSYVETDRRGTMVWRRISILDVSLVPWWNSRSRSSGNKAQSGIEAERQQMEKLEERAGIKILHDWVKSFEDNKMERFKFEWPTETKGDNPLLLGESVGKDRLGTWFSAPPIRSRSCKEVWLGGCYIGKEDIRLMESRLKGLERVMVWRGWLGEGLIGKRCTVNGTDWVGFHIEPKITGTKERGEGDSKVGKPAWGNRALDEETQREKGYGELDGESSLSDTSMEVPVFLDV